ncbi:MAG: dUTP diphosphatase [Bacteroidetes bacterium]|nr:dUTP diphosphatase [Bacteroidota bacterium]MBX7046890.1 dUTP diphosphatase [Ignavibacteria bacterium]
MKTLYKKFDASTEAFIPEYKTSGSAGADLRSSSQETISIKQGERKLVPTNLIIELPDGYEAQVRPRSGLALNHGVTVLNTPGTIDSDYRGEVKVLLINHGEKDFEINFGDRIAQLVIAKHEQAEFIEDENLSETERAHGGYGSTGVK